MTTKPPSPNADERTELARLFLLAVYPFYRTEPGQMAEDLMVYRTQGLHGNDCGTTIHKAFQTADAILAAGFRKQAKVGAQEAGEQGAAARGNVWLPISTAPKGKAVLVAYGVVGYSAVVAYQTDNEPPLTNSWRYANGSCRGEQTPWPTHWMPLPPPPTATEEGERK